MRCTVLRGGGIIDAGIMHIDVSTRFARSTEMGYVGFDKEGQICSSRHNNNNKPPVHTLGGGYKG